MNEFFLKFIGAGFLIFPSTQVDVLTLKVAPAPMEIVIDVESNITADSVLVFDLSGSSIIAQKNAHTPRPVASLTKLMTALVIMENHSPYEIVTISQKMTEIVPAKIWLLAGETLYIIDLMRALLIPSANDAALALAFFSAGGLEDFADIMNQRGKNLGLKNTQFKNPHGFDQKGGYSTARDLAFLTAFLLNRPDSIWGDFFRKTIATGKTQITSVNGAITHEFENTNDLLWSQYAIFGVKTGTTDQAGQCLILLYKYQGREFIVVILGSKDRYGDAKKILSQF